MGPRPEAQNNLLNTGHTHKHLINVSGVLVCVKVRTCMRLGHMRFNSECYQSILSGHTLKVNSWIIYIRLVKQLSPIAPCCANHFFPHKRECTRWKGGEGTERKNV